MSTDRPRRLAAATLALTVAFGLAGCGTGGSAQTSQQYQPGVGSNLREGDVQLFNALLVQNTDGSLSFSAGLVNTTDVEQALTGATISPLGGDRATQAEPSTDVTIAPRQLFTIGSAGELAGIEVPGLTEGRYAAITMTFDGAGDVSIEVPVVARTADYSQVAETPADSDPLEELDAEPADEAEAEEAG